MRSKIHCCGIFSKLAIQHDEKRHISIGKRSFSGRKLHIQLTHTRELPSFSDLLRAGVAAKREKKNIQMKHINFWGFFFSRLLFPCCLVSLSVLGCEKMGFSTRRICYVSKATWSRIAHLHSHRPVNINSPPSMSLSFGFKVYFCIKKFIRFFFGMSARICWATEKQQPHEKIGKSIKE